MAIEDELQQLSGQKTTTKKTSSSSTSGSRYTSAYKRDVLAKVRELMRQWGLAPSLADWVWGKVKGGSSLEGAVAQLKETGPYKRRFAGLEARKKAGLGYISEDEYIGLERGYRQALRGAGLPATMYDQPGDFSRWIAADVSVRELSDRIQGVYEVVKTSMPQVRATLAQYYGVSPSDGALLAYALDPKKGIDVIARQVAAAQVGAAAARAGLTEDRTQAEQLVGLGVGAEQARAGFGEIAAELATERRQVGATVGPLSQKELEEEVFAGSAQLAQKRKRRAQESAALFGGGGGVVAGQQGVSGLGAASRT